MKRDLINIFIDCLISETLNDRREWHPLYQQKEETSNQNENLYYLLFESEFHKVMYDESYFLPFENGFFFFIHEWSESGRDGTIFDGYNLYAQPDSKSKITLLLRDAPELYRLKNAILEKDKLPEDVESFITEFLEA